MTSVDFLLTTAGDQTSSVSYVRGTGATQNELFRRVCTNGAVVSTSVVIRDLGSFTFACTPACDSSWTTTAGATVSVTVVQPDLATRGSFSTTVLATKRVS
jgi:hypothetical protein